MKEYHSPGCHFIDRLESATVLRQICKVVYVTVDAEHVTVQTRLRDVVTRDGADWCELEDGTRLRLDQIIEFTGLTD